MKIVLAVLLFFLPGLTGQGLSQAQEDELNGQYESSLFSIITHHPDKLVNYKLVWWLRSGKVNLQPKRGVGLVASQEPNPPGIRNRSVYIWYDRNTMLASFDPAERLALVRLDLYHQCALIEEHFQNRHLLLPLAGKKGETPRQQARRVWGSEWAVFRGEWELAKKMGMQRLMPIVNKEVSSRETPETFLEAFYKLMTFQHNDPVLRREFERIYKSEKYKLAHPK